MRMHPKNKFAAFTATLVAGGTVALANDVGFRGNCEIHEAERACRLVGSDPLHTHHDDAPVYVLSTNTATTTGGGAGGYGSGGYGSGGFGGVPASITGYPQAYQDGTGFTVAPGGPVTRTANFSEPSSI